MDGYWSRVQAALLDATLNECALLATLTPVMGFSQKRS